MAKKKIETIINEKIYPHTLNEKGKSSVAKLVSEYPYDLLCDCINIAAGQYFRYDKDDILTNESVENFLNKIGGIAHNKTLSPIEQTVIYLLNIGNNSFNYWNKQKAKGLLLEYINQLKIYGWNDAMILSDLKNDVMHLFNESKNWTEWVQKISNWIKDIEGWIANENSQGVVQLGSILPDALIDDLPNNVKSICKQINASFENNLYDCTAIIMRRLLESLLVLSYQHFDIENDIMDKSGNYHVSLDKIIKISQQNETLGLSFNTKKDMMLFKDLGNYSAHKIWYNCTKGDIQPNALKYRAIIEELLYKAGLKS